MSTDYYTRLEQRRGPHPSTQILGSLARALRLDDDERDHLYILAGQAAPTRIGADRHVGPGLMHLLTKLDDTPACVVTDLGEILASNAMFDALSGGAPNYTGLDRYVVWRFFMNPDARRMFVEEDWEALAHKHVADLRAVSARRAGDKEIAPLLARLRAESEEFEKVWSEHRVAFKAPAIKRFVHPDVGVVAVHCETLATQKEGQHLMVYSPQPGPMPDKSWTCSESSGYSRCALLWSEADNSDSHSKGTPWHARNWTGFTQRLPWKRSVKAQPSHLSQQRLPLWSSRSSGGSPGSALRCCCSSHSVSSGSWSRNSDDFAIYPHVVRRTASKTHNEGVDPALAHARIG